MIVVEHAVINKVSVMSVENGTAANVRVFKVNSYHQADFF